VTRGAAVVAVLALLALAPVRTASAPERPSAVAVRGVNFTAWWHDEYATPEAVRSLDALAAGGATAVALVVTQYQDSPAASSVAADPERTPSDAALRAIAASAKERGMRIRLRLLVDVRSGESRVTISPADPDAWFASYAQRVRHYAWLAGELGADTLEIGAELKGVSKDAERWREVVAVARAAFGGRLAYAANWDEFKQVRWWDAVDEIGVDAWFPVAASADPAPSAVLAAWRPYLDALGAVAGRFRRPVVLSELGYSSSVGALIEPWRRGDEYSAKEQVTGLRAAFRALTGRRWLRAIYLWHWSADPEAGGPGDTDHTVQHKPAEALVRTWLRCRR
jgi:hypothetical protein